MVFLNEILNKFPGTSPEKYRNKTIKFIFDLLKLDEPVFIEISEIENYKNIYYPIVNPNNLFTEEFNNPFGDILIDLILHKNVKVIFFNTNETHDFDEFKFLNDYLIRYNIPQDKIYLFYNNPKIYEYKKIINSNINVYCPNVIMIEHSNLLQKNKIEYFDNKKFLMMCHNNKMHEHRILNLALLHKNNLLNEIDYSSIYLNNTYDFQILNKSNLKQKFEKSIKYVLENLNKKSFYEKDIDSDEINSDKIEIETFKNSYFNLVVETDFNQINLLHPTEKSLKPFYYLQYPIFVAPKDHVSYLRETYGFDMFDDIINHSYDSESDAITRMLMIHSEIQRIFENKNFYKNKYKEVKNRLLDNHKLVCDIVNNTNDRDYVKNILYGN